MPWINTGTAAGDRQADDLSRPDWLRRRTAACSPSWPRAGTPRAATAWVFKLRDATFHNGKPVTAADVKWTLEQVAGEKSTAYLRAQIQGVEKIETPDPHDRPLVMKEPAATLPTVFANFHMPIISQRYRQRRRAAGRRRSVHDQGQERGVSIELEASSTNTTSPACPS